MYVDLLLSVVIPTLGVVVVLTIVSAIVVVVAAAAAAIYIVIHNCNSRIGSDDTAQYTETYTHINIDTYLFTHTYTDRQPIVMRNMIHKLKLNRLPS